MGGPSLDWVAAYDGAATDARRRFKDIDAPVLLIEGDRAEGCLALPHCTALAIPGAGPALELEPDARRRPWLDAVTASVRERLAAKASPLPNVGSRL
jgi:hypothetical protein